MSSSFHEVLFPTAISYGSSGGPRFKTTIFTADSGYESRNIDWANVRSEYNAQHGIKTEAQMEEIMAFFMARRGRAYGFRYKDFGDFKLRNQVIGTGDATNRSFQIVKTYLSQQAQSGEAYTYSRRITKIAWNTVAGVTVNGVANSNYTVDHNTGMLTFGFTPGGGDIIKIGAGEFHVPVRFDTDHLDITQDSWNAQSWGDIPIVEVRDWSEAVA